MAGEDFTKRDMFVVLQKREFADTRVILEWSPLVVIDVGYPKREDMTEQRILDAYAKDYAIEPETLGFCWAPRLELPPSAYFPHDWIEHPKPTDGSRICPVIGHEFCPVCTRFLKVCRKCKLVSNAAGPSCQGLREVSKGSLPDADYRAIAAEVGIREEEA